MNARKLVSQLLENEDVTGQDLPGEYVHDQSKVEAEIRAAIRHINQTPLTNQADRRDRRIMVDTLRWVLGEKDALPGG